MHIYPHKRTESILLVFCYMIHIARAIAIASGIGWQIIILINEFNKTNSL